MTKINKFFFEGLKLIGVCRIYIAFYREFLTYSFGVFIYGDVREAIYFCTYLGTYLLHKHRSVSSQLDTDKYFKQTYLEII